MWDGRDPQIKGSLPDNRRDKSGGADLQRRGVSEMVRRFEREQHFDIEIPPNLYVTIWTEVK
jgi:hypothetical protein